MKRFCIAVATAVLASTSASADDQNWRRSGSVIMQAGVGLDLTTLPFGLAPSSGVLQRRRDEVIFDGTYTGLAPDSAYSAWWLIANKPMRCMADCGLPDIEAGVVQIFYAGGFLTDSDGHGDVSARLPRGPIPVGAPRLSEANDFGLFIDPASEVGLRLPKQALVAVVVRNHGPIDPANLTAQVGSYVGGCEQYSQGDFTCFDQHSVLFTPPPKPERKRRY